LLAYEALFDGAIARAPVIPVIVLVIAFFSILSDAVPALPVACAQSCIQKMPEDASGADVLRGAREAFRGTSLAIGRYLVEIIAIRAIFSYAYWQSALTLVSKEVVPWVTDHAC
jgi:hypothetical protein